MDAGRMGTTGMVSGHRLINEGAGDLPAGGLAADGPAEPPPDGAPSKVDPPPLIGGPAGPAACGFDTLALLPPCGLPMPACGCAPSEPPPVR